MNAPTALDAAGAVLTTSFNVPGLHCANCIATLENGLAAHPDVVAARVNFTTRRVRISHLETIDTAGLRDAIGRIGFPAEPFLGEAEPAAADESRMLVKAMAVAGFAAMNVMLLSVSVWSGATDATRQMFHWLSALIALPAVAYAGRPFFRSAWSALRRGRTNMDVPISIGVVLACAISLYETAIDGPHAYFDGAVMLLFFLLAGRFLDSVMRARAQDGVEALLRQTAAGALVIARDGSTQWRAADELARGMRMLVAAGERLAADGVVEQGASSIDRALITGESLPEAVTTGKAVLAGTINLDAPLTVRVTAAGENTVIADIARMMEAAGGTKSRYVRVADRAARFYAPAVHTLALLSFIGWMIAGAGAHQSILIAVAVLIITCPCALGLAVPVAQVVAAGAMMRAGILIKDGSALERLAEADSALFDKTGTLTLGRPVPNGPLPLDAEEKPVALALARSSRHPLSRALAGALEVQGVTAADLTDLTERPGAGVEGRHGALPARLGRPDWLGAPAAGDDALLATAFRLGDGPARLLRFTDALRADAPAAIARLRDQGMEPLMLSGDRASAVDAVAGQLGITGCAALSPAGKFAMIARLQQGGRRVLMVGDGLNDGPALKAADVSIAPASASDVGQTAADLVFLGDGLMPVPVAIAAARRTMRVVRQNFAIAIGYNVLAVPLAIAGYVTPLVAALAMSGSSLIVVANALRLRSAAR
ncbi:MAG: nitrogen fixation protein FixI [Sphingomonas sp. SCN 67-18]|uniref:heavy metal translocating P-type ATPase n=1 Tax=uncultured Sphingomonas sp. TaxID=158754 RepID=UPI00086CEDED|nr:heavy metal translocating P-type ATPase [Sphingomonas sp. SCN 67-18]ODU20148.1 MAG: nitrogen fixation protein FixI [Sphingomonas sp. SCN 67-18]